MARAEILTIDQGTTGTKVLLFDDQGTRKAAAYREHRQYYPQPGWVEHDAVEIWENTADLIQEVLAERETAPICLAITNQRETVAVWDRVTGNPLAPAVVWQCRRSVSLCRELQRRGLEPDVRRYTGLPLDPYFSGTKIAWLLQHDKSLAAKAESGEACIGTIDSWLLWKLTGGRVFATDYSNASRTMLYNIGQLRWEDDLLEALGIPRQALPEVCPSSYCFGRTEQLGKLPGGIAIQSAIGDSQAALFGQACFHPGMAKATYGTGTSFMVYQGPELVSPPPGMVAALAWGIGGDVGYALEGIINVTGAAVQWLRDGLGIIRSAAETEALAASLDDNGGVYMVPAFVGLGAPHWDMDARALICGITRGTGREHMARAALEAMAYQVKDVSALLDRAGGVPMRTLRADGGASENRFLMQFQADILGIPIQRPAVAEISALGAAYLAGLDAGIWPDKEAVERQWRAEVSYEPCMDEQERRKLYGGWTAAVRRSLSQTDEMGEEFDRE